MSQKQKEKKFKSILDLLSCLKSNKPTNFSIASAL